MVWNSPFSPQISTPQAIISSTMARSITRPSRCRGSTRRSSVLMRHRYPSSSTSRTFSCRSWCHRGYTASNPTFRQRSSPQARLFSMSISPKHTSSAPEAAASSIQAQASSRFFSLLFWVSIWTIAILYFRFMDSFPGPFMSARKLPRPISCAPYAAADGLYGNWAFQKIPRT